ncbi:thiol reductant ABC exporter subunit CydC [Actinoalloteichus sp. AHMU CJ021]|nr:thiol reductant ABC exporter subunit CydC [Actinoalloteichus sp. AHMU CJ021]
MRGGPVARRYVRMADAEEVTDGMALDTDRTRPESAGVGISARRFRGPLGPLPALSTSARRSLVVIGLLAVADAVLLVAQAVGLATALTGVVVDRVPAGDVLAPLGWAAAAVLGRSVVAWALESTSARAAGGVKRELRSALLDSALGRGPEWIHRGGGDDAVAGGVGRLSSLATTGLDALDPYFRAYLPALVTAAAVPPLVGGWILLTDPPSAALVLVTVPLIPLFAALIGRYTEHRSRRAADATARLSGHLLELVRSLGVLTAFRRAGQQAEAVRRVNESHRKASMGTLRVAFLSALALELLASLSVALVAVNIGLRLVSGSVELVTALVVLLLVPECYRPLRAAGAAYHASEDGVEAVRRVHEVLVGGTAAAVSDGSSEAPPPRVAELRVSGLRVARRDRFAPDGLSFTVSAGQILRLDAPPGPSSDRGRVVGVRGAVAANDPHQRLTPGRVLAPDRAGDRGIGPSGSGKSTTFSVLMGFVRPDEGQVLADGRDVTRWEPDRWRSALAWVPQHPRFTAETVSEELRLALSDRPGATATDAELGEVAASVGAARLLGRSVRTLSVGERQRVAVARALLRVRHGASVLLLDEPTANLDRVTAARVMAAVEDAADRGVVVVLATHRPTAAEASPPPSSGEATTAPGGGGEPVAGPAASRLRDLVDRRTALGVVLGAFALAAGVALTGTAAWLIATAAGQPPVLTLTVAAVSVRTFALSKALLRYLERLVSHDAAFRLSGRLRVRLWNALVRLGPARVPRRRDSDTAARLVGDVDQVRDLVPRVLLPPAAALLVGAMVVLAHSLILPSAGAVTAVALVLALGGGSLAALAVQRRAERRVAAGRRRVAVGVLDLLDSAADLVAVGAAGRRRAALAEDDRELGRQAARAALGAGAGSAVLTAVVGAAALANLWLGASAVAAGALNPVLVAVLVLSTLAVAEVVATVPPAVTQAGALRDAQRRLDEVWGEAEDDGAVEPGGATTLPSPDGEVVLRDVDAGWPGHRQPVLREVTLRLPAGAHVAVLGPSGAGKSTLLALLLGFVPPRTGVARLPDRVAWCPQDPALVSTSVRENLRVARPGAGDAELRRALAVAGLPDWGDRLDAVLGSGGLSVSGGEAARLGIARAVLAAPDSGLVLLDEPTAHLDATTSREVLARLRAEFAGRTVVHVTHRPEEVLDADLVVEVRSGAVREYQDLDLLVLAGSDRARTEGAASGDRVSIPRQNTGGE